MKPGVTGWAEFSKESKPRCRWALGRDFEGQKEKGLALFVGLNPSRAGADLDDMTVTKGMGFARAWDLGGTVHANAFPFITPYPDQLAECTTREMEENDRWMVDLAARAKLVVFSWGAFPQFEGRFRRIARLLAPFHPVCLGTTKNGYPKHISRIGYATAMELWRKEQELTA